MAQGEAPKKFETEVHLSREMGLMDVTLIGVGAMIGAGIFVLTGIAAGVAGPGLLITFSLNAVVALFTAMSYAELGSCYHDAGGGYLWVKEGLPKWNGFISGWMSWFGHAVACSLYALGFGAYFDLLLREFHVFLPHWGFFSPDKLLAVAAALIFAYINFRGASETGKVGNLVTLTKIAILAVFIAFGVSLTLHRVHWHAAFTPFLPHGWSGVFKAMGLTFIAFQGFEVISQCSEEVNHPRRNIPRAVFLSLLIVVPIYLLVAFTAIGSVTPPAGQTPWAFLASKKETALVDVARSFFTGGGILLLFGGLISTMSALNATVYSSSRVAFAMGRDRNFPTFFSRVNKKTFAPHFAILFSLGIIVFMASALPIEDVASAADIMFLLLFLQVNITLIRLRRKRPDLDRGFFVPLFPYLSIVGIVALLLIALYMVYYSPIAWVVTLVWIAAGLLIYKVYASRREIAYARRVRTLQRLERKEYKVLLCLSNQRNVRNLVTIAEAIARKNRAELLFLHVKEVKQGDPLALGMADTEPVKSLLEKAGIMVAKSAIPHRLLINVSHRISQGIVQTAEEEECNFIILGREKHPTFLERFFSSVIDSVVARTPGEMAVLHGDIPEAGVKTLMIPFSRNVHTLLATEIAPAFTEYFHCRLKFVMVFPPEMNRPKREEREKEVRELVRKNSLEADVTALHDVDVLQGILYESRTADMILLGGRTGDFLELLFGKSLVQEIIEQTDCPVLWVKEFEERESFWHQLLKPAKLSE